MGEADVAEDGAEIATEVVAKRVVEVVAAVKAAVKVAAKVLKRAEHGAVNHALVRNQVYVNVLDVQKVAVTVVNVLARLVKAKKNLNPNLDLDPNLNQEQIKS